LQQFEEFVRQVLNDLGLGEEAARFKLESNEDDFEKVAKFLWSLNKFLYVERGQNSQTISDFHEFWENNHQNVLGLRIDYEKCKKVAERLEYLYTAPGTRIQHSLDGYSELETQLVADARFFTSIQDFRYGFRKSPYQIASEKPDLFDASKIAKNEELVDSLLRELGAKSQYDKRRKFAVLSAELLNQNYEGHAINIAKVHVYDAVNIRDALVSNPNEKFNGKLGFSNKKANMLIRDLYDLGIWTGLINSDKLDVSSDRNTMRIALRLGIFRTRIPLLTSYLDVYCYQYSAIDSMSSAAWRSVWEKWGEIPNNHRVAAPAFFDFLIYWLGKICCKYTRRACEIKCSGASLKRLRELIPDTDGYCPFKDLEDESTKMLNPPLSISRYGDTSWTSGKINTGGGGGISS